MVSDLRAGGVENDTQHKGELNEYKVNSQENPHIKEQCEKVSKIRNIKQAEWEQGFESGSLMEQDQGTHR